jgi:DNA processing protein
VPEGSTGLMRFGSASEAMSQSTFWSLSDGSGAIINPIDATLELGAYETLWSNRTATFKRIAEQLAREPGTRPSQLVPEDQARTVAKRVLEKIRSRTPIRFDVRVHGESEYPSKLRDAVHPVELLYFQGDWDLVHSPSVAVVGTRKPSKDGIKRTRQLVRELVRHGYTVVSGLAEGVDTAAHEAAIEAGGRTIGVIGTPLGQVYPKSNAELQEKIAKEHLLISQVPVERYDQQGIRGNRFFFPERNKTMAALTEATIIVEAGDTSGTLIQARAALQQGRKLLIMNSCFERPDLTWPAKFEAEGAVRIRDYGDIRRELDRSASPDR